MNSVEDQVRAAMRAQAQTLREVRPLRLVATPAPARRTVRGWRWRGWLAPLAAAALVIAVAVALVIVRGIPNGRGPSPIATPSASSVPPYYVGLYLPAKSKSPASPVLAIGVTATGARLATITPPRGSRFAGVTGAADDRTFVVSTMLVPHDGNLVAQPVTWYLLRIEPGRAPGYRMTRLAIPDMRSWSVLGIALSDSGRELAMTVSPPDGSWMLRIYSVATGKLLRGWSVSASAGVSAGAGMLGLQDQPLSWTDGDRGVVVPAFSSSSDLGQPGENAPESERLIDVTTGSGDLIANSRVIWTEPAKTGAYGCAQDSLRVTADGKTVICPASPVSGPQRHGRVTLAWLAYPASAPTASRVLYQVTVQAAPRAVSQILSNIVWSDASGSTLIVEWTEVLATTAVTAHFGVVSHGRFRPLPPIPGYVPALPPYAGW